MGYLWKDSRQPEIKEVDRYVEVPNYVEVLPPLPECKNPGFDPEIGGLNGAEIVGLAAKMYQHIINCENALYDAQN